MPAASADLTRGWGSGRKEERQVAGGSPAEQSHRGRCCHGGCGPSGGLSGGEQGGEGGRGREGSGLS